MASPAAVKYALVGAGVSALSLALLQALLAQRLERAQILQLGPEVAFNLRLGELALDRLPPAALSRLSGLPLRVGANPPISTDRRLQRQARQLQQELCREIAPCLPVLPAAGERPGVWVELLSPLEPVWLFTPLDPQRGRAPDPLLLGLALLAGSISSSLLYLWWEVQRPLQQLEQALAQVGNTAQTLPSPLPAAGSGAVRRLTARFKAMVQRLAANERDRTTMLAGIAHDLKSPLTRLRLRLAGHGEQQRAEADLDALERITGQFLLFAGGGDAEAAVHLPLDQWLAELSAAIEPDQLQLDLEPLEACVQPTALGRAVGNLIDNAFSHGQPPLRLVLRREGPDRFRIEVWDRGPGISAEAWPQALQPFQRLDRARGGSGHCGLGLAIAARVAASHGGQLECRRSAEGFAVVLRGRSVTSGHRCVGSGNP
ncbi:MAG: histidine kinase [Vulcanococcus sp.]|jgi:two-component system osmolarity sensor histidine kinase EnvZ|uniref:ATP-binding protein n=1 Tax=Vulcanococcus sp. TaxID=2856995 RepID=UPI0025E44FD3|nr:ATP-binding protein [Vulcanococcus sp.]MBW0181840.1 histidine kinase [Vulcanococcus sp.]